MHRPRPSDRRRRSTRLECSAARTGTRSFPCISWCSGECFGESRGRQCAAREEGRAADVHLAEVSEPGTGMRLKASLATGGVGVAAILAAVALVQDWSLPARASIIAGLCLFLWLGELVPV